MRTNWWILATAILTCCAHPSVRAAQSDPSPIRESFIISAHRAGGRVHAPDNSMPNILGSAKCVLILWQNRSHHS